MSASPDRRPMTSIPAHGRRHTDSISRYNVKIWKTLTTPDTTPSRASRHLQSAPAVIRGGSSLSPIGLGSSMRASRFGQSTDSAIRPRTGGRAEAALVQQQRCFERSKTEFQRAQQRKRAADENGLKELERQHTADASFLSSVEQFISLQEANAARNRSQLCSEWNAAVGSAVQKQIDQQLASTSNHLRRRQNLDDYLQISAKKATTGSGVFLDSIDVREYDPIAAGRAGLVHYNPMLNHDPCKLELRTPQLPSELRAPERTLTDPFGARLTPTVWSQTSMASTVHGRFSRMMNPSRPPREPNNSILGQFTLEPNPPHEFPRGKRMFPDHK